VKKPEEAGEAELKATKRPYRKPVCEVVQLVSDEVLAIGCKYPSANGQFGWCNVVNPCPTRGS
jgi:hypothetical protein